MFLICFVLGWFGFVVVVLFACLCLFLCFVLLFNLFLCFNVHVAAFNYLFIHPPILFYFIFIFFF